jgi:putative isomerase
MKTTIILIILILPFFIFQFSIKHSEENLCDLIATDVLWEPVSNKTNNSLTTTLTNKASTYDKSCLKHPYIMGSCTIRGKNPTNKQQQLQEDILQGWNTWNNPNLLSFVKMPEGLALTITYRHKRGEPFWLNEAFIAGPLARRPVKVEPIAHSYNGSYIEMEVEYASMNINVRAAHDGDDIVILITPWSFPDPPHEPHILVLEAGILWNKPDANISYHVNYLEAELKNKKVVIHSTAEPLDLSLPLHSSHMAFKSDKQSAFYTGKKRSLDEIKSILDREQEKFEQQKAKYEDLADAYEAMQAVLAWNLFYEAENKRALTSVSRLWNESWGGYIIFDWDTYFAALMYSIDQKELAYANAIAMTNGITDNGFIPNWEAAFGRKSFDRSQPPVGSMCVKMIYDKYKEEWFLREVYDNLLTWNRWWDKNRNNNGYLSWGSDPHPKSIDGYNKQAAMFESGLDNSPLFDDAVFNTKTNMLELADVGLMSLYVADCKYLSDIAQILGRQDDAAELTARADRYGEKLMELWDENTGIFRDKYTNTGKFSNHLAPTNFYPMLAGVATQQQAERMISEYFFNPNEFYGVYILPSISRSNPAFADNTYWRGRIWAPMNFLVYMGLRNYDLPEARTYLVDKSLELLMKEWRENKHVYENYNSVTGEGGDVGNSDAFYSWSGLFAFIALMEKGYY